ncbi:MAG: XdhC/CoxI family protein [Eubacteriales bacterium]|nr:XdhC/CoxI family protein [Eubacteriales bacterium]
MDKRLLDAIEAELAEGNSCMLATVLVRRGSAPRGIGTSMIVSGTGKQSGTVGGGSMEHRVKLDALALLIGLESTIKEYVIHADEKDVYSGGVTVLFRAFAGETSRALVEQMRRAYEQQTDAFLVCRIENGTPLESNILLAQSLHETCGIACPPDQPILTEEEPRWLVEPLRESPRVILFGGGHVAQCMARQLDLLDYRVWVAEDREAFASDALFPSAERVLLCDYTSVEAPLNITRRDHAIVMSRGHETDYQIFDGCCAQRRTILGQSAASERLRSQKSGCLRMA